MSVDIGIVNARGDHLFSLPEGSPVPRVGDHIRYNFTAWSGEEQEWAATSWAWHQKMNGTAWLVREVEYIYTRRGLGADKQRLNVWVRVIKARR